MFSVMLLGGFYCFCLFKQVVVGETFDEIVNDETKDSA